MTYPRELPSDPKESFLAMHEFLAQELVDDVADNVRYVALLSTDTGGGEGFACQEREREIWGGGGHVNMYAQKPGAACCTRDETPICLSPLRPEQTKSSRDARR